MRPELEAKFAHFIAVCRSEGYGDEEIERSVEKTDFVDRSIDRGLCPQCGAPVRRIAEEHSVFARSTSAGWVMYRCSRDPEPGVYVEERPCGFMVDKFEPRQAN